MKQIKVFVNGKERLIQAGMTLSGLIESFQLKEKAVVLELNRNVVDRGSFPTISLQENDTLEIVHFVGGG